MQAQQVFDAAATFLRLQKERCFENGKCLFRNSEGMSCVAGFFIKDEFYSPEFENPDPRQAVKIQSALELSGFNLEHVRLLDTLQYIHDSEDDRSTMPSKLYALATEYGLNAYVVDCIYPVDFENQPKMTAQQVFDVAATFMRLQKERCAVDGKCYYRLDGRCCIGGFFIKDKYYDPKFEGSGILTAQSALKSSGFNLDNLTLLRQLQDIHDRCDNPANRQEQIKLRLLEMPYDHSIVNCIFP